MRDMKDSGVEWIGDIPVSWDTIAFWQAVERMGTGLNPRDNFELSKDGSLYYVTIRNFKNGELHLDEKCDRIDKSAWKIIQERSQLQTGDILFASISKDAQAYILNKPADNWNINESVFCFRINTNYFYNKYFYYQLINKSFYDDLRIDATGTTFQSIKQEKLKKSRLVLPLIKAQHRIADYLDEKCKRIDSIIEKQREVIDKLKAYKLSVITEAATKGLNPDAPMKDSGVEWIGRVPITWRLIQLKYLVSYMESGVSVNAGQDAASEDECGVLKTSCVSKFEFDIRENKSVNHSEESRVNCPVKANTIIVSRMNTPELVGACGYVSENNDKIFLPDRLWQVHFQNDINVKYIWYYLRSKNVRNYIASLSTGTSSTMQNISRGQFINVFVPLPSEETQDIVVSILDKKCSQIELTITKKQAIVDKLTEYKKSLIYEVVTGKKEV